MATSEEAPGAPETPPPATTSDPGPSRAEARIQALTAKLREQEERIKVLSAGEVERERDQWRGKAESYQAKLDALKAEREKEAAGWQRERAFLSRGLTDEEGQAVTLALYSRLPEEGRPDLGAWMDSWRVTGEDGEVEDRTPAAVRAYLQSAAPPPADSSPAPRPPIPGQRPTGSPASDAERKRVMDALRRRPGDPELRKQWSELQGR